MRLRGYNALLLYCVLAACQRWTGDINADGDGQLQVFQGDTLWRLLPNLWTEKNIAVRCPNSKGVKSPLWPVLDCLATGASFQARLFHYQGRFD